MGGGEGDYGGFSAPLRPLTLAAAAYERYKFRIIIALGSFVWLPVCLAAADCVFVPPALCLCTPPVVGKSSKVQRRKKPAALLRCRLAEDLQLIPGSSLPTGHTLPCPPTRSRLHYTLDQSNWQPESGLA